MTLDNQPTRRYWPDGNLLIQRTRPDNQQITNQYEHHKATHRYLSGSTATIQNSEPLVTSNKARDKYDLPNETL